MKTRAELTQSGATFFIRWTLTDWLSEIQYQFADLNGQLFYVSDEYNKPDEFKIWPKKNFGYAS